MSTFIQDFKTALSGFASGVTVVTYSTGDVDSGITVSAFSSVSLDPPLVLVCLNNGSPAVEAIESGKAFSVNILSADQSQVSNTFAKPGEERMEYLKKESQKRGENGVCHIPGALAVLDCELESMVSAGDHNIALGKVTAIHMENPITDSTQPLVYFNRNYRTTKDL